MEMVNDHFYDLATPNDNSRFDYHYLNRVKTDLSYIEEIYYRSF